VAKSKANLERSHEQQQSSDEKPLQTDKKEVTQSATQAIESTTTTKKPKEEQKEERNASTDSSQSGKPLWRTAVDPHSGRTYYYDAITRKSQWEKVGPRSC
jgi:hypothetical protein